MTQPHKTLAECKDEVARKHTWKNWPEIHSPNGGSLSQFDTLVNEAAELYASQFVKKDDLEFKIDSENINPEIQKVVNENYWNLLDSKKDPVSSDVEQAAKEYANNNPLNYVKYDGFIEGYKFAQSTQQSATINWLTDDEIEKNCFELVDYDRQVAVFGIEKAENVLQMSMLVMVDLQTKLKERVDCVDPVEEWISIDSDTPAQQQDVLFSNILIKNMEGRLINPTVICGYYVGDRKFKSCLDPRDNFEATHWMPLPNPPKTNPNGQK